LGLQSRGFSFGGHTETHESEYSLKIFSPYLIVILDQRPDLGHIPDHQAVPTEGEPETESVANGEESKEPEEPDETVTHLQNSQPDLVADPLEEEGHEDQNGVGQAPERGEDQDSHGDEEESPTVIYPTVEDNDRSVHGERETAVIGLDVLEAEVVDPQLAEDEAEDEQGYEASAPLHDGSEDGGEIEHENEPEFEENPYDVQEAIGLPGEQDEVNQGLEEGGEQGDEFPHEHSEYAEPDAESGTSFPSHFRFMHLTPWFRTPS